MSKPLNRLLVLIFQKARKICLDTDFAGRRSFVQVANHRTGITVDYLEIVAVNPQQKSQEVKSSVIRINQDLEILTHDSNVKISAPKKSLKTILLARIVKIINYQINSSPNLSLGLYISAQPYINHNNN